MFTTIAGEWLISTLTGPVNSVFVFYCRKYYYYYREEQSSASEVVGP